MSVILRRIDSKVFYPVTYILEEYHVSGDLIDIDEMKFIITDESNSVIYLEKENEWRNRFYPGKWIRIFPLFGILELESDEPIDVPGFRRFPWGEEKRWLLRNEQMEKKLAWLIQEERRISASEGEKMEDFMCARICDNLQLELHKDVLRSIIDQDEFYRVLGNFSVEIMGVAPDTGAFILKFHDKDKQHAKTVCDSEVVEVTPSDMFNLDLQNRFRNVGPYEVESSNPNWTREGNKPVVTIYGYSDDTVEIENSNYNDGSIDCFDKDVRLWFSDGTIIRIGYCKPNLGVWYIVREHVGTAEQTLLVCEDEDADPYSDVFCINAEIERHEVLGGNFGEINITEQ